MVGSVGGTSNLINMISLSYQQSQSTSQGSQGVGAPPPPNSSGSAPKDPLGVFDSVDTDSDSTISESEYNVLSQGIMEITGSELSSSFLDFDSDGDGLLNPMELKSVLDEAGFEPPAPPPQQISSAYEAQSGVDPTDQTDDDNLLAQLLEYLENGSGNFDITA